MTEMPGLASVEILLIGATHPRPNKIECLLLRWQQMQVHDGRPMTGVEVPIEFWWAIIGGVLISIHNGYSIKPTISVGWWLAYDGSGNCRST